MLNVGQHSFRMPTKEDSVCMKYGSFNILSDLMGKSKTKISVISLIQLEPSLQIRLQLGRGTLQIHLLWRDSLKL